MRFRLLTAWLILFGVFSVGAGAPRVLVEKKDFDFGQTLQGQKVEHVFTFRNVGQTPLTVNKVKSSCGCTAAVLSSTTIAPGETGELKTVFDSKRFQGAVAKTVYLYLDGPDNPVLQFSLRGTVAPVVKVEPDRVVWQDLKPGQARKLAVTLTNQSPAPISLLGATASLSELKTRLPSPPNIAAGGSVQVEITVEPREGKPTLSGYVHIQTDSMLTPKVSIPVHGQLY